MSTLPATEYMDLLVRDYLKFRGFNSTVKTMDADLKTDKDKGFRIDRIMQHILSFVNSYDLQSLRSYWTYLDSRFFCRFAKHHEMTVKRLETNLYRLYIVHALQNSKAKEVIDFFDKMCTYLQNAPDWKEWFIVPFIQSPENNPTFAVYFSRQWAETFLVSLHNFLSSMFSFMPEPDLVIACVDDGAQIQKLEKENQKLKRSKRPFPTTLSQDTETKDTPFSTLPSTTLLPKYMEAKGIPGALVETVPAPVTESKRSAILGFVTRQSSGTTSPKTSNQLLKQSSKGNDLGVGPVVPANSSVTKTSKKSAIKDNVTLKQSTLDAQSQRRELLAVTKKMTGVAKTNTTSSTITSSALSVQKANTVSSHPVQDGALPLTEQIATPGPVLPANEYDMSFPSVAKDSTLTGYSEENGVANGDLISYKNTISLTKSDTQVTVNPVTTRSARSAVDEFVASYDFVNNLHKMSLGQLPDLDPTRTAISAGENPQSLETNDWNLHTKFSSVIRPTVCRAEEPFLVLSKDVYLEHHSGITQCAFDVTGTTIASIDTQGVVKVWQSEPHLSTLATVMLHSPIQCFEWCSNPSDILFLGTSNGAIRFFETTSNITLENVSVAEVYPLVTSIATHPSGTSFVCSCVRPSPDSGKFSSLLNHGILLIWSVRGSQVKLNHTIRKRGTSCETTCMEYNHNGNLLVAGDFRGSIALYDMKSYEPLHSWDAHQGYVSCVQFSSDETRTFSLGSDGQFLAWNVHQPENRLLRFSVFPAPGAPTFIPKDKTIHRGRLFSLDPTGKYVLMARGNKGIVYKIDIAEETLSQVLTLPEHKSPVTAVDWTSNKTCGHCLTGSSDGKVQVTTLLMQ